MTAIKVRRYEGEISPEIAQNYIMQMLDELSLMAQSSGLKEMASLLKATSAASRVDIYSEVEA